MSVVISSFNRAAGLERVLTSLLERQDAGDVDFEVVVVDNGSTDRTSAVLGRWKALYPNRLQCCFEPQRGVSFGRNAGVAAARGTVIAFTDDDNAPAADWIRTIGELFAADSSLQVCGGKLVPLSANLWPRWLDRRHWSPLAIVDYGAERFWSSASNPVCLLTANLAVRRSVFDRVGLFSPRYPRGQDHEWLLRFWDAGGRALYVPELVVMAPVEPERLTKTYHRRWYREHGRAAARMRLQERIAFDGHLKPASSLPPPFAAPPFLYRQLATTFLRWLRLWLKGDRVAAFEAANHLRYLRAYLAESAKGGSKPGAALRSLVAWLHTRRRRIGGLTVPRVVVVYALMAMFFGGSAYDIVTGREHWPLSPYPMFAEVDETPVVESVRLIGVTGGTAPREVALLEDEAIHPFDQCRLSTVLGRAYSNPERREHLQSMARDVLVRYERRRKAGAHDGPQLEAVRAYWMRWEVTEDAANRETPNTRRLLVEARARDQEAGR